MDKFNSRFSTIMGGVVAVAMAYTTVDWTNFEFNARNIIPLVLSGLVAFGGYMTALKPTNLNKKASK